MGRVSDYVPCSVTHSLRVKSVPVVIERRRVVATGVSPCAVRGSGAEAGGVTESVTRYCDNYGGVACSELS